MDKHLRQLLSWLAPMTWTELSELGKATGVNPHTIRRLQKGQTTDLLYRNVAPLISYRELHRG